MSIRILLVILFIQSSASLSGQNKKILDYSTNYVWPTVNLQAISDDGQFIFYSRDSGESGSLIIQGTDNSWTREIFQASNAVFAGNSKWVIYSLPHDTMSILSPGTDNLQCISRVTDFKVPEENDSAWLAFRLDNNAGELMIRNLFSGETIMYDSVINYQFSDGGKVLLILTGTNKAAMPIFTLHWLSLRDRKDINIWEGAMKPEKYVFDSSNSRLSFMAEDSGGVSRTIFYFQQGLDKAHVLVNNSILGANKDLESDSVWDLVKFSNSGGLLFFRVKLMSSITPAEKIPYVIPPVDIWSFTDKKLQSKQLAELAEETDRRYTAAINCLSDRLVRIEERNEQIIGDVATNNDQFVLLNHSNGGDWNERGWNQAARPSIYLVSLADGTRRLIKKNIFPMDLQQNTQLSTGNNYILYFDQEKANYFSYSLKDGISRNITRSLHPSDETNDMPGSARSNGLAAWVGIDKFVLLYDNYDIWKVDLSGRIPPVNMTKGYGRKNRIVLRCIAPPSAVGLPTLSVGDSVLLVGFNMINKYNGFFRLKIDNPDQPEQLYMGPYLYYYPLSAWTIYTSPPLKARKAEAYALTRRSNVEAPNVYFSRDLRQFRQLSHSYPQKDYNWMTSQLVHWNRLDGKKAEGILYKPENFDSTKKYPVIFYFYEKDADAMYDFIFPALNTGELDIPLFVSNGYLVIDPNIYYTIPNPGSSVINSVVSAAKFLSTLSYVDPTRMGVQGISFGGYEVNYLITHSHLFAAAAEAAGPVDFISGYGSLNGRGESLAFQYELAQNRLGATLWQRPDLYIRNSPIFRADKITTPLLIMHNKEDEAVPFAQGVELFTALRRLGKPVWMLQYDGEGHGVERPVNQFDYSQRLAQFFDHFLKGAPAPKWMTSGIPAERKGVDSGLEMEK